MSASKKTWAAFALFVALAIGHTWPLASAPGRYSRNDNMDTQLNEWTMAWVAHQVVHDPVHLFDANIFYPQKHTLAFSENLFVQGVMAMPLYWAGVSPVAAFNIILIAGLALTGWAMWWVINKWTGCFSAGVVAGSLVAFNANTLSRLVHIQAMHLEFFPLMLFALDQLLTRPRPRAALATAGWFVLEALTSVYFLVFVTIAAIAAAASRPSDWLRENRAAFLKYAALAAVVAGVLLAPFLLPYFHASQEQQQFTRKLDEVARFSAHWKNYLAAASTLHMETLGWSKGYASADYLFPGFTAIALMIVSIVSLTAIRDKRARMALAFGVVSFALSFGPAFPLYALCYKIFPLLHAIRGAARFGQMALAAIAMLAGFGVSWLAMKMPRKAALTLGIVASVLVNVEAWRAPIGYCGTKENTGCNEFTQVAPIFATLNRPDVKAIVVFPFYPSTSLQDNARYMLQSTAHWKPMLNGYSGYMPVSMFEHYRVLRDFPSDASIAYLKALGISHVLVDGRNAEAIVAQIPKSPFLVLENTDGNLQILKIK
jgi:hypothetical protein